MKTEMSTGTCEEYLDLWERESRKGRFKWRNKPSEYGYFALTSPNRKITSVLLFDLTNEIWQGLCIVCIFIDMLSLERGKNNADRVYKLYSSRRN
jgi:hypothetical protein